MSIGGVFTDIEGLDVLQGYNHRIYIYRTDLAFYWETERGSLFIHLQNHGPFPSRLLLSGLGKHLVADLPEDILLGAWGAVGGSGAGDGVDVGYEAGSASEKRTGETAAVRRPTHLRHKAMSRGRETLSLPRHAR